MRVPALSRHRTGQGVVRIAGKDYYCGLYESPECKRRYELLISEFLANKHSYVAASSGRTVDELILSFSEYAKETYTAAEFNNIRLVMKALLALYGDTKADDFGPIQFKTLREKILSEGTNRSRQYVNKCMRLSVLGSHKTPRRLAMIEWQENTGQKNGFKRQHLHLLATIFLPPSSCHHLLATIFLPPSSCHHLLANGFLPTGSSLSSIVDRTKNAEGIAAYSRRLCASDTAGSFHKGFRIQNGCQSMQFGC
ncbi:hypothetical protein VN12_26225 [Pirellula sp. SH-Sr6A]|uniref:hypothetical protein n=1 Tax=Pirellula sp. SH-Sr6A TaxID=1632865 RepID=UPI00078EAD58|nr:hypothetical protein [Pirellula sp. SH-Sr6A]AMV35617.1 hypothetical protein VN12_26225 [Pirellula sp. SH-Sr6A]